MTLKPYNRDTFMRLMDKSEEDLVSSEDKIREFYKWMYSGQDGIIEACAFHIPSDGDSKRVKTNKYLHTTDADEFAEFCKKHSGLWRYQVYSAVNAISKEPEYGRCDVSCVDRVNIIPFDIETERKSYQGSSKEEVWWSYKFALAQAKFLNERFGVWPLIVMSENGVHLHVKADFPVEEQYMHNKQHIYSKYVTEIATNNKYIRTVRQNSPSSIKISPDDVSDVPRVMKVPGTLGIKSENGRLCGIIHKPNKSQASCIEMSDIDGGKVEDFKQSLETESVDKSGNQQRVFSAADSKDAGADLSEKIQRLKKEDELFAALWDGDTLHYDSRSEAEMAFVMKLLSKGFTEVEVRDTLSMSAMTKWNEDSQHYRDRTIDKALANFDGEVTRDSTSSQLSFESV